MFISEYGYLLYIDILDIFLGIMLVFNSTNNHNLYMVDTCFLTPPKKNYKIIKNEAMNMNYKIQKKLPLLILKLFYLLN